MKYTKDEMALLFLDSFGGLEYRRKVEILELYEKPSDLFKDSGVMIKYITENIGEEQYNQVKDCFNNEYLKKIFSALDEREIIPLTCCSEKYPVALNDLPFKPLVLYCKGRLELLENSQSIAIVGSRKTSNSISKFTESISTSLAENGTVIVTGSAVGGDRSAILGALESGNIISVLAHGTDYFYPECNRTLIENVMEKALVISEYPPDTPSAPWRFPMRNRIIAALGYLGTLVVSGSLKSGTRHTAKFAEEYSRELFAVPYSIHESGGEFCNLLIKLGKAHLVESIEDIAFICGIELNEQSAVEFDDEETEVLNAIDGCAHIDLIAERTGKKVFELLSVLSILEIKGAVTKNSGNEYISLVKMPQ